MNAAALDAELRTLQGGPHADRLSTLHAAAATLMESPDAARFHLTHAWIYALVAGDGERIAALEARLSDLGGL